MATPTVTTHVLDAALGRPAAGIGVRLERADGTVVGEGRTDGDGRVASAASAASAGPRPATTGWCSRPVSGSPGRAARRSTPRSS